MLTPRAAVAIALLAIAWLATSPNAAQAQTCPTATATQETVCNIYLPHNANARVGGRDGFNDQIANAFTTGNNAEGYALRSVHFQIREKTGNPGDLEVRIYNTDGSNPGTSCNTLSGAARPDADYQEYTGNIRLERNATYYLVLSSPSSIGDNVYWISDVARGNDEGNGGWGIANRYLEKLGPLGWRLIVTSGARAIRFAVVADAIQPPGVTAARNSEPITEPIELNESGAGNSTEYTLVLDAKPNANVTILPGDSSTALNFSPSPVGFAPDNWDTARTVTVTAADNDDDAPGDRRTTLIFHNILNIAGSDSEYSALTVDDLPQISIVVLDDDAPPVSCLTEMERGSNEHACNLGEDAATGTFALVGAGIQSGNPVRFQAANAFTTGDNENGYYLRSVRVNFGRVIGNPGAVRVAIHADGGIGPANDPIENGVLSGNTPSDDNPPDDGQRDFTASGDIELDDETTYYLVLSAPSAPSGDNRYWVRHTSADPDASGGWSIDDGILEKRGTGAFITIAPNAALHFGVLAEPIVGLIASTDTLAIDEAGANNKGEYTLVLDTAPSADVVITPTIEPRGVAALSATTLTFTAANWDTPSTITVTAIDDRIDNEGDARTAIISHAVDTDAAFTDTALPQVSVTVVDDETALRLKLRVFLESALP